MPATGNDLGSDLKTLLEIAHLQIPQMAQVYQEAASILDKPDDQVFNELTFQYWVDLYQHYIRLMSETQASLQDTAVALTQTVNAYIEEDAEARKQLNAAIKEHNETEPNLDGPQGGKYEPPDFPKPVDVDVPRDTY